MSAPIGTVEGTTPYAWPCTGPLDTGRTALLVVGPPDADPAEVPGLADFVAAVRGAGVLVVEVGVVDPSARGRRAASVVRSRPPRALAEGDVHLVSAGWDGFYDSPLDALLRRQGRDTLLVCGAHLEVGVHSTMRSANDRGYEVLLVQDLCLDADPALRPAALSSIEMSGGIFGAIGTSTAVLAALPTATSTTPASTTSSH